MYILYVDRSLCIRVLGIILYGYVYYVVLYVLVCKHVSGVCCVRVRVCGFYPISVQFLRNCLSHFQNVTFNSVQMVAKMIALYFSIQYLYVQAL